MIHINGVQTPKKHCDIFLCKYEMYDFFLHLNILLSRLSSQIFFIILKEKNKGNELNFVS